MKFAHVLSLLRIASLVNAESAMRRLRANYEVVETSGKGYEMGKGDGSGKGADYRIDYTVEGTRNGRLGDRGKSKGGDHSSGNSGSEEKGKGEKTMTTEKNGMEQNLDNTYTLPDLKYPFKALEPYIDTRTMKLHHDKHHATYVANINKAVEGQPKKPILDLMENALESTAVRNNGGGHYNHAFFWDEMAPSSESSKTKPSEQLLGLIEKKFGSMEEMKAQFEAKAAPGITFGSGWVWLCVKNDGSLEIVNSPNQDNPLMRGVTSEIMYPILGLDVWEHAYYLKYQNLRTEYVSNWWNVVNWTKVSENCAYAVENKAGVPVRG